MRQKRCKACKQLFEPERPMQAVCGPLCAFQHSMMVKDKLAGKKAKEQRKETRERLDAIKPRAQLMREAQAAFNKWIRARDMAAGYACISSGRPLDWTGNAVDAGHYRSVGSAPHLRFNEDNCHAQSKKDNRYGAGCAVDYRIGLIARIGLERVEALERDNEPRKYSMDDLRAITAHYKGLIKA